MTLIASLNALKKKGFNYCKEIVVMMRYAALKMFPRENDNGSKEQKWQGGKEEIDSGGVRRSECRREKKTAK